MICILYVERKITILRASQDSPTHLLLFPAPSYFHLQATEARGRSPASLRALPATPPHFAAPASLHPWAIRLMDRRRGHLRLFPRLRLHGAAPSNYCPSIHRSRRPRPAYRRSSSAHAPRPRARCYRSAPRLTRAPHAHRRYVLAPRRRQSAPHHPYPLARSREDRRPANLVVSPIPTQPARESPIHRPPMPRL